MTLSCWGRRKILKVGERSSMGGRRKKGDCRILGVQQGTQRKARGLNPAEVPSEVKTENVLGHFSNRDVTQ
jgi:hypothetical protein